MWYVVNGIPLITLLAGTAFVWAALLTLQGYEHRRYALASLRRSPGAWHRPPRVLICIPCKGLDLELADNLRCILRQNYANYAVRFVVECANDVACATIEQVMLESPVPCELLVAGPCTDSGQKIHNLCFATSQLPEDTEVLVFFDSDARPAADAVARLVDRVCRGGLQVATGYRWFVPRRPTIANFTLASVNAAIAGLMKHHGWNLIWGGCWAISRQLFEATAVAQAWQGTLSDDLVASRVVRSAGARIVFEPGCMVSTPIDVTWKDSISFLHRQFVICRCYAPLWWWLTLPLMLLQSLVLFGGLVAACVLAYRGSESWYWPLFASIGLYVLSAARSHWRQGVWSCRMRSAAKLARVTAQFDQWAAPFSCLFATGVMLLSAIGRTIVWRGIHYHIGAAGRITLLGRVPDPQQRQELLDVDARRLKREQLARCAGSALYATSQVGPSS